MKPLVMYSCAKGFIVASEMIDLSVYKGNMKTFVRCFQYLLITAALVPVCLAADTGSVSFVGDFSNIHSTAEHSYGSSVQLWRQDDKLFGLFYAASGLSGDTPTGQLEDVQYDPATGKLSFKAKLSVGAVYMGKGKQEPTHDIFSFKGSLQNNIITGVLTHEEKHQTKPRPIVTRVRLTKSKTSESPLPSSTYDEWRQAADQILKVRGPKW
jgi:hypothetical protein